MPLIVAILGGILLLMPMTASRLAFRLCGLVVLVIGCAMLNWHPKPKDENMFRVKIGGEELSHGEEVGKPERRAPGRTPPPPKPEQQPEAVPEPPPPPPKQPGIDYEALNRAKQQKLAEAKKKAAEKKRQAEQAKKKKLDAEKKRQAELEKKKKEAARKKWLEKKKKLDTEKKRIAELKKKKRLEAEKKRIAELEKKKRLEAEKKRKERESIYNPAQDGPIGDGGNNLNPNVPVGNKDRAQAHGQQDNRSPGGGARVKLAEYANRSLLPYLKSRWKQPPDSLLGGKRPSVDIALTIGATGRVEQAVIRRASGVAAMDESVKILLAGLDILPRPPEGKVDIAITLQTE
jgi:TonB family protein